MNNTKHTGRDSLIPDPMGCSSLAGSVMLAYTLGRYLAKEWGYDPLEEIQGAEDILLPIGLMLAIWLSTRGLDYLLARFGLQRSTRIGIWVGAFGGVATASFVLRYSGYVFLGWTLGMLCTALLAGLAHRATARMNRTTRLLTGQQVKKSCPDTQE